MSTNPGEVTLDIETSNIFNDVGGYYPERLNVSLVGIHTSADDKYRTFRVEELRELWPILEHATRIIGFNIKGFDFPVLNRYYGADLNKLPVLDILEVVKNTLGFRLKLDTLVKATLGEGKSGDGLKAIEFYKNNQWEELAAYCLDDVRLTKDLYLHGLKYKQLAYDSLQGEKLYVNVDFGQPATLAPRTAINLRLPI